jgi:hypothetical protein
VGFATLSPGAFSFLFPKNFAHPALFAAYSVTGYLYTKKIFSLFSEKRLTLNLSVLLYHVLQEAVMEQAVYTVIAAVASPVLLRVLEYLFKERQERRRQAEELEQFRQELHRFTMLALKCVVTNKELSLQARLDAYDEYKKAGGNSWLDRYVSEHLKEAKE